MRKSTRRRKPGHRNVTSKHQQQAPQSLRNLRSDKSMLAGAFGVVIGALGQVNPIIGLICALALLLWAAFPPNGGAA
jgi:uncharacterized protein (DUF2062 family)